jgi:hypothetical protein
MPYKFVGNYFLIIVKSMSFFLCINVEFQDNSTSQELNLKLESNKGWEDNVDAHIIDIDPILHGAPFTIVKNNDKVP